MHEGRGGVGHESHCLSNLSACLNAAADLSGDKRLTICGVADNALPFVIPNRGKLLLPPFPPHPQGDAYG